MRAATGGQKRCMAKCSVLAPAYAHAGRNNSAGLSRTFRKQGSLQVEKIMTHEYDDPLNPEALAAAVAWVLTRQRAAPRRASRLKGSSSRPSTNISAPAPSTSRIGSKALAPAYIMRRLTKCEGGWRTLCQRASRSERFGTRSTGRRIIPFPRVIRQAGSGSASANDATGPQCWKWRG